MKFEEIREMETEPFDEEVLEYVYYQDYAASAMMSDGFAALIFLYFRKFDERYGTQLTKYVDEEQILPCFIDDYDQMLWDENIDSVISQAMHEGGWHMEWLMPNDDRLRMALEEDGDSKETFHEAYKDFLDEIYYDCFVKSCFLQEEEEIKKTFEYLEEGEVGIIWNSSLERYKKYRKENKEVVAAICPEEDYYIAILQEEVWKPFVAYIIQKKSECEDGTYIMTILGCDGYNFCSSTDIDPNWILKVIKLGWMLRLAWEKIDCYEEAK